MSISTIATTPPNKNCPTKYKIRKFRKTIKQIEQKKNIDRKTACPKCPSDPSYKKANRPTKYTIRKIRKKIKQIRQKNIDRKTACPKCRNPRNPPRPTKKETVLQKATVLQKSKPSYKKQPLYKKQTVLQDIKQNLVKNHQKKIKQIRKSPVQRLLRNVVPKKKIM